VALGVQALAAIGAGPGFEAIAGFGKAECANLAWVLAGRARGAARQASPPRRKAAGRCECGWRCWRRGFNPGAVCSGRDVRPDSVRTEAVQL